MFDRMLGYGSAGRVGLAVLAAIAMAVGATACGSDDSDGSTGQSSQAGKSELRSDDYGIPTPDPALRSGSNKDQIRYLLGALQSNYIVGKAAAYCSSISAAGRKQIAAVARQFGHGSTCEDFVTVTSKLTRDAKDQVKQKPTVLQSVRVDGNRAVAKVSDGGRPPIPMVFVKRDGRWKLLDPGFDKVGLFRNKSPRS
jgi:hypothetical protein